jgi:hypothetical protein
MKTESKEFQNLMIASSLRLILTTIFFLVFKKYNTPFIYIIVSFFILDSIDCDFFRILNKKDKCRKEDTDYQIADKISDLYTYILFILLFNDRLDSVTKNIYYILLIWRTIGVFMFTITRNKKYIVTYFDGLNGLLIVYLLSNYSEIIKKNYILFVVLVCIFKYKFEIKHHL